VSVIITYPYYFAVDILMETTTLTVFIFFTVFVVVLVPFKLLPKLCQRPLMPRCFILKPPLKHVLALALSQLQLLRMLTSLIGKHFLQPLHFVTRFPKPPLVLQQLLPLFFRQL
jgi:hypothetical protein